MSPTKLLLSWKLYLALYVTLVVVIAMLFPEGKRGRKALAGLSGQLACITGFLGMMALPWHFSWSLILASPFTMLAGFMLTKDLPEAWVPAGNAVYYAGVGMLFVGMLWTVWRFAL